MVRSVLIASLLAQGVNRYSCSYRTKSYKNNSHAGDEVSYLGDARSEPCGTNQRSSLRQACSVIGFFECGLLAVVDSFQ